MILIFVLGAGLTYMFGKMVRDTRQGWALFAAMSVMFLAGAAHHGVFGARPSWSALDPNGNLLSKVSLADYYATLAQWFGVPAASVLPVPGNVIPGIVT